MIKNRTPESEFGKMFHEIDTIFFCETWRDRYDQFDVIEWDDEFQEYSKNEYRDFKKGRSSGGIYLFIRKTVNSYCNILKHDEFRIWCKIDKGIF